MKNQEISWEELLAQWKEQFPVFRDNQPLAISTRKQMALRGLLESPAALQALVQHVRSDEYLGALASGGHRFNLDGSIDRTINSAHVQSAARILAGELPRLESLLQHISPRTRLTYWRSLKCKLAA